MGLLLLLAAAALVGVAAGGSSPPTGTSRQDAVIAVEAPSPPARLPAATPGPPTTAAPVTTTTEPAALGPVTLTGCPPPPPRPGPRSAPWHPAVLVPDAALPAPTPPATRTASLVPIAGKGMWIWKYRLTEGGDAAAIVTRARAAGLRQLWVRVGDSKDGFYAASVLDGLVPLAHHQGISVIGWGFPYLYDPAGDAAWSRAALDWRGPDGSRLDAFSPDVETGSEGTALSERRAVVYLSLVRPALAATGRPLVATVFPPTDRQLATYPFRAMAPYVDAFAPMVYWSCREPGDAAAAAIARLSPLAPVHLIGQAYDMADEGGRVGSPSGAEIRRFFDAGRRAGAQGVSLWDWQEATAEEWRALSGAFWPGSAAPPAPPAPLAPHPFSRQ